ncbi:hypothetical protein PLESTM_001933500 [Pleodorina starrii]|nr:hypothetical protein PLESTM_001933500 [Pleodorina starrii]
MRINHLEQQLEPFTQEILGMCLAGTAGSTTPDWQAKVEWLEEELGYPRTRDACSSAVWAANGDSAVARLQWLCSRGYPIGEGAACIAVHSGNLPALRFLVEEAGVRPTDYQRHTMVAAREGHLGVLQYLHDSGFRVDAHSVAEEAAWAGHLPLVAWAVEVQPLHCGVGAPPAVHLAQLGQHPAVGRRPVPADAHRVRLDFQIVGIGEASLLVAGDL